MRKDPGVIDYVPARGESGAGGRLVKSFLVVAILLAAMGFYRSGVPDSPTMGDSASMALVWYFGASIFGAIALMVGYSRWLRTGRLL